MHLEFVIHVVPALIPRKEEGQFKKKYIHLFFI